MTFSLADLYFFMIFITIYIEAGLNPEKDNVCLKTIIYNVTIKDGPAPGRGTVACLKGRNCDEKFTVATKEPRVITRTKIIPSCCEGYEEDPEGTRCVPICPKGCGNGRCETPGKCVCEAGFSGPECVKMCDEGKWGENCFFECNCSENEVCNKISGCMCKPGWTGEGCYTPCPEGHYGFLCEEKCLCDFNLCDPATGTCINPNETVETHFIREGTETPQERFEKLSNAGITEDKTVDEVNKVEDFGLSESRFSTTTSENEMFDQKEVAEASAIITAATIKPPNFKFDKTEDEENPDQTGMVENSSLAQERNFKPVKDVEKVEKPTKSSTNPTVFNTLEMQKRFDILNELMNETVLKNELLNTDSDKQMTPAGNVQNSHVGNFIPTFTVLSGVTVLIILIVGKWFITTVQKKIKKMTNVELGCPDEEFSILSCEKLILENNMENPAYAPDILKAVPTLQTFKPPTAENERQKLKKYHLVPTN